MTTYEIRTNADTVEDIEVVAVLPEDALVDWVWTQPDGESVTELEQACEWITAHGFHLYTIGA